MCGINVIIILSTDIELASLQCHFFAQKESSSQSSSVPSLGKSQDLLQFAHVILETGRPNVAYYCRVMVYNVIFKIIKDQQIKYLQIRTSSGKIRDLKI